MKVMLTLYHSSTSTVACGDLWRQRRWFFDPHDPWDSNTGFKFKPPRAHLPLPDIETVLNYKAGTLSTLPYCSLSSLVFRIHFCFSLARFLSLTHLKWPNRGVSVCLCAVSSLYSSLFLCMSALDSQLDPLICNETWIEDTVALKCVWTVLKMHKWHCKISNRVASIWILKKFNSVTDWHCLISSVNVQFGWVWIFCRPFELKVFVIYCLIVDKFIFIFCCWRPLQMNLWKRLCCINI